MKNLTLKVLVMLMIGSLLMEDLIKVVNCSFVLVDDGDADQNSNCIEEYSSNNPCDPAICE